MGVPPGRSVTQSVPKKKSRQIRELVPTFGSPPLAPRDNMLHDVSAISGSEIRFCVVKQYCVTHPRNACCVGMCVQGLVAGASLQNQLLRHLCRTLISSSSGNSPTFRQVRLQDWNPRNQVDPLWRYFTRHDNTHPGTPLPATDKTF